MTSEVDVAVPARLMAEPARAAMLNALLSGEALAAGELARVAGISPATASEHLAQLRAGGLVTVVATGRHRYYRMASTDVAHAIEALGLISPPRPIRSLRQSRTDRAMSLARTCYDHLAGRIGVAIHDRLIDDGLLATSSDGYWLTDTGQRRLDALGVDLTAAQASRRVFARACLDFTERRPHLAGGLGAVLCEQLIGLGWFVRRGPGERALRLTDLGRRALHDHLNLTID